MNRRLMRVAAYIRVSTDHPSQEDSFETQEKYFTRMISDHRGWACAGIYSDYGISATQTQKRTGFLRLLRHCEEGRIDRIVCKSISRFARNTADFLQAMEILRQNSVTVYFEKENLDTGGACGEFIMTTLSAFAQEESRSISENIRWSMNRRLPQGDVRNYTIYGYRYAEGENAFETTESGYRRRRVEIVPEQARIVRRIFSERAEGKSLTQIARDLNLDQVPAPVNHRAKRSKAEGETGNPGKGKEGVDRGWTSGRIGAMIRLERYAGDVSAQKTCTPDYLTHKAVRNTEETAGYYIRDHHPAIIERELFLKAQRIAKRHPKAAGSKSSYPLSGRLICAHCGRFYYTRNRRSRPIWYCPSASLNNGKNICHGKSVYEKEVEKMLQRAVLERFVRSGECSLKDLAARMKGKLETVQETDYGEREILYVREQLSRVRREKNLTLCEIKTFLEQKEETLDRLPAPMDAAARRLRMLEGEEKAFRKRLEHLETYYTALETDYLWRKRAMEWLITLPDGQEGTVPFLNGLSGAGLKAFVLSITVYSPQRFKILWFDDTETEIHVEAVTA